MRYLPHLFVLGLAVSVVPQAAISAQDTAKPAEAKKQVLSPRDTTTAKVAGATVTIDYSRPSMRGRKIYGELVPYGKVWRTGANEATTFTTDKPLLIGKSEVPAGTYTIFTIPNEKEWQLIINKQTGQWGTRYDPSQDLVRIPMSVKTLGTPVEQFEILVDDASVLHFRWDTTDAMVAMTEKKS